MRPNRQTNGNRTKEADNTWDDEGLCEDMDTPGHKNLNGRSDQSLQKIRNQDHLEYIHRYDHTVRIPSSRMNSYVSELEN
jgi:hypothetical protein